MADWVDWDSESALLDATTHMVLIQIWNQIGWIELPQSQLVAVLGHILHPEDWKSVWVCL